ncbi:MAG: adenosylcobinamide-GDP ribazoletransferase [Desulfobulbus sp.]|jgi:adenosylcobinamide-GDP ribazoletransferase
MRPLILMIQFMTRYPIPMQIEFTAEHFVRGMKWMPVVGLLCALPAALGFAVADHWLGRDCAAVTTLILWITVTGALHLDGIADTADGLFSYRSRERMLEIMRDSALGVNGVTTLALAILVKFVLLRNLPDSCAVAAVLTAPVLGRMALTWHAAGASYARNSHGLGDFVNRCGLPQALGATLISCLLVVPILAVFGVGGAWLPLCALLLHLVPIALALLFARYLKARLGGITGDTIGASIELSEMVTLLLFVLLWKWMP